MASVYLAEDLSTRDQVAVKVLRPELALVLGAGRFEREIAVARRLKHPNVVSLLDAGQMDGILYYVMPYIRGQTLRERIRRESQLPVDAVLQIAAEVTSALEEAHRAGIVHRDLKPENILMDDGRAIVADFGVARIIATSGVSLASLSSTGLVIGTPAYMSPEQATAERTVDGRSDIYSLGCVLYELLAGVPPFGGPTAQAIAARHLHDIPPSIRVIRPGVPEWVEQMVMKMLAKVPADRYAGPRELLEALDRGNTAVGRSALSNGSRRMVIVGLAAAGMLVAALIATRSNAKLDPDRYAVLPFRGKPATSAEVIDPDNTTQLVWRLVNAWQALSVADQAVVTERIGRETGALTLSRGLEVGRSVGAGTVIWGDVVGGTDSITIRAAAYSTNRLTDPISRAEVTFSRARQSASDLTAGFTGLVRDLVAPGKPAPASLGSLWHTTNLTALRATLAGDSALQRWNLPLARDKYREAFTADPQYPAPRLRFAQTSLWLDSPAAEWEPVLAAALSTNQGLAAAELDEARALESLGRGDFPAACRGYQAILQRDSLRFGGWFGIGECSTRDSLVEPDRRSPSGWRFRTSYAAGIAAYVRALTLAPGSHVAYGAALLDRMVARLKVDRTRGRIGASAGPTAASFLAFPSIDHDTLAFVPYPIEEVLAGRRTPQSQGRAIEVNRRQLLDVTRQWIARYPESPPALRAFALASELNGRITDASSGGPAALDVVRRLRVRDPGDIELASWECRLLVKAGRYLDARTAALRTIEMRAATREQGTMQAALAALIGKAPLAAALLARFDEQPFGTVRGLVDAPPTVKSIANTLLAYSAFGESADSIATIARRLEREIDLVVSPTDRSAVRDAAFLRPALLAYPILPPPRDTILPIARLEQAIARHDEAGARREFIAIDLARAAQMPTDVTLDHVVLESRLALMIGDTTRARTALETALANLGHYGTSMIEDVAAAAALGRAFELLADLSGTPNGSSRDPRRKALWNR
jgi:hypothetical protein